MKKIIPFKKKLNFDTNVSEVTSISLENTLHCNDCIVEGDLIINGNYKVTDSSIKTDDFEFRVPVNIEIDNKYLTDNIVIDIDDFYYEIVNNNILEVNIDLLIDNLILKPIDVKEDVKLKDVKSSEERCIEEEVQEKQFIEDKVQDNLVVEQISEKSSKEIVEYEITNNNIFSNFSGEDEELATYHVYIVREGDTVESIMSKYQISKEILIEYNDISELKLGDKLIIPQSNV